MLYFHPAQTSQGSNQWLAWFCAIEMHILFCFAKHMSCFNFYRRKLDFHVLLLIIEFEHGTRLLHKTSWTMIANSLIPIIMFYSKVFYKTNPKDPTTFIQSHTKPCMHHLGHRVIKAWLGAHFWHFENSISYHNFKNYNYNNYQIISPISVPYFWTQILIDHPIDIHKYLVDQKIHMKAWKLQCEMKKKWWKS
jgi:hypothetical protein